MLATGPLPAAHHTQTDGNSQLRNRSSPNRTSPGHTAVMLAILRSCRRSPLRRRQHSWVLGPTAVAMQLSRFGETYMVQATGTIPFQVCRR